MSNQNLPKLFFFNIEPWKEVYNEDRKSVV